MPLSWARRRATTAVALLAVLVLFGFARLPRLTTAERLELASRFDFERIELPALEPEPRQSVRDVHPSLYNIAAWVSATGASAALADLDADGLSNDLCWVDPRFDEVIVLPVPGSGERYGRFVLRPDGLRWDPDRMDPIGCLTGDLNEDGLVDLLVYYWGRTPVAFLRRAPEAPPAGAPEASDFVAVAVADDAAVWNTNALALADVDGDGHLDLVVGNYFQDGAPVVDPSRPEPIEMQDSMSRAFNAGHNRILLWQRASAGALPRVTYREAEGVFEEIVARGWTLALGAQDLDGDLLPELYFANDFGPDRLLHNRSRPGVVELVEVAGAKTLTSPNSKIVGRDSFKGMGVDFGDVDGDGLTDIYVSNIAQEYSLEESHFLFLNDGRSELFAEGAAPFRDAAEELGLSRSGFSWEARLADFDNDGVLEAMQATGFVRGEIDRWPELQELALSNDFNIKHPERWPRFRPGDDLSGHLPNPFFVRAPSGRYFDLAPELGMDQPQVSRGIATGDVDADGDLDFVLANQWEPSAFYRNRAPSPGRHLTLRLMLPVRSALGETRVVAGPVHPELPARPAVGATATVSLPDGRVARAEVDGGNGHSGARAPELHFGLGEVPADAPLAVELEWRDRRGRVHRHGLELRPGWHTVILGTT